MSAWRAQPIRNVIGFNLQPDGLGFVARALGRDARIIRIAELGPDACVVSVEMPSTSHLGVFLPKRVLFGCDPDWLEGFLATFKFPSILLVHRATSLNLIRTLVMHPAINAIGFGSECTGVPSEIELRAGMDAFNLDGDLAEMGLSDALFFADHRGHRELEYALASLDASIRRRRTRRNWVYDVSDFTLVAGIYPIEREREWSWAWTGPETLSTFLVPAHGGKTVRLTIFFFAAQHELTNENLKVLVDDQPAPCQYFPAGMKIELMVPASISQCFHRLDLLHREMVPTQDHSKHLGFALSKLKIEVDP